MIRRNGGSDKTGGMKKWLRDTWANIRSSAEWWPAFAMMAALTALVVMLIFGFVPLWFPEEWKWGKDEMSILKRMKFAGYLVGGVFFIWQLEIMWRLEISRYLATALGKTAASGEKCDIIERYKNAFEHLAHETDSMQTGGIHILHHIAKEEEEEHKETVLEALLMYLQKITAEKEDPVNQTVMAIWDALFARRGEKPLFDAVDLSHVNLKGIGLGEMLLFPYNLSTINGARELDLTGAFFESANLSGADMSHSVCDGTIFNHAACVGTRFKEVTFKGASFIDADLREADFRKSNITGEQLLWAKTLYKAKLPPAVRKEIMRVSPRLLDKPDEDK